VRDAFRAAGVSAEMVTGDTPKDERASIINRFKRGEFRCLVNVAVLTTGFNVPDIDCLIFMRPMRSPVLYVQCIGRGVRVTAPVFGIPTAEERLAAIAASQKPDCLLLDFGNVVGELGPVDKIEVRKRPTATGKVIEGVEAPAAEYKRCPSCGSLAMPSAKWCLECGYGFATENLTKKAGDKAVISTDAEPEEYDVFSVKVERHVKKEDKENDHWGLPLEHPLTLRVTYSTIGGSFSEFICFEHHRYDVGNPKRYAWDKAVVWHKQRIPTLKPPISVKEALTMGYDKIIPKSVTVRKEGKYSRIIGFKWQDEHTPTPPTQQYEDFAF
jgi:DNA repair protein RadD